MTHGLGDIGARSHAVRLPTWLEGQTHRVGHGRPTVDHGRHMVPHAIRCLHRGARCLDEDERALLLPPYSLHSLSLTLPPPTRKQGGRTPSPP
jgi:hypothetical protein